MLKAVITDIDGTLTDERRRLNTVAIETIRRLQEHGIMVVLASGNTSCLLKGLSKLIGTSGTFIGENGGVYRIGFTGELKITADHKLSLEALDHLVKHYSRSGVTLEMYSPRERFADVAFARSVPVDEVRSLLSGYPVTVLDTSFAIHLQQSGINKGTTFRTVTEELKIPASSFLAIGDSENDLEMIREAGVGCCVFNASQKVKGFCIICLRAPVWRWICGSDEEILPLNI